MTLSCKKNHMINHQQRATLSGIFLFLLGLGIVISIALFPKLEAVRAQAVTQQLIATANSNSWRAASFPVENFQAYTSPFGYRRSASGGNGWEFHNGLDIAAPLGSFIRNWFAGTVVRVGDGGRCGTNVVIQSGLWRHTYCHMMGRVESLKGRRYMSEPQSGLQIWEGQTIPVGTRIGRIGMTGRTTGPHLHWGLKYNNQDIDPALVLREMFAQQIANGRGQNLTPKQSSVTIEPLNIRD